MYASCFILFHFILLRTFILIHRSSNSLSLSLSLLSFLTLSLSLISLLADWPMLGLLDFSLGYPINRHLSQSGKGFYYHSSFMFISFSLRSKYVYQFLLHSSLLTPTSLIIAGTTFNHNHSSRYNNESVNEGDVWEMEVDLRSREKEKRTLHWFVRGKQQKGFIKGVPDRVRFGVCFFLLLNQFMLIYLFTCIYSDMHSLPE